MTDESPNLAAALAKFQAEMPTVGKAHTANVQGSQGRSGYSYTYADLADVMSAAMPLLTKNGLSFSCCPRRSAHGDYDLVGILLHESGEKLEGCLPIQGSRAQEIGSSLTYGRRYLLGCMTGLVTDDDDDGNAAQQAERRTTGPRPASAEQSAEIGRLMDTLGMTVPEDRLAYVRDAVGHTAQITVNDAAAVLDRLRADIARQENPA